jgi:hypothetical protein
MRRIVLFFVAIALGFNLMLPLGAALTTSGGVATYGSSVITASSTTVIFVYPDTAGTPGTAPAPGKPDNLYPALFTDWVALGIPIGAANNPQYETVDTSTVPPLSVDPLTGQPGASTSGMPIVTVGGVLVHSQVYYLEKVALISPVYYDEGAGNRYFKLRAGGTIIAGATMPLSDLGTTHDYFVIYTCVGMSGTIPGPGNTYYVFYGYHYRGSQAATHLLLNWIQTAGALASKTGSYYVYEWTDTNSDGIVNPSPTDTYTLVASG